VLIYFLKIKGNVYVIRDKNIYSSALAFTSECLQIKQFITIGQTGGYLGGRGVAPTRFILPDSKLMFQMEMLIDLTNVKELKDFYHQNVEIPVNLTNSELVSRYRYNGDLFDLKYLRKKDPVFKKILELESK